MEWVRFAAAVICLLFAVAMEAIAVYGVYKFRFVMNRMHAAAIGDTLAMMSCMLGLIIWSGFNFTSLKLLLVVVFLCFSSPVSSHLIMNFEVETNEKANTHYDEEELEEGESIETDREA